jgi:hypothetical protein
MSEQIESLLKIEFEVLTAQVLARRMDLTLHSETKEFG